MSDQVMTDSSTDNEQLPPQYRVTEEEKRGTIPGSKEATSIAVGLSTAHGNPVVNRTVKLRRRKRKGKASKVVTSDSGTQTNAKK